jgi:Fe-S cluster assembly ATP-binding protein
MTNLLEIQNIHINVGDREIVKGLDLVVNRGEVHAIMGPNGSGKSTLASTLMGHPFYTVTRGQVLVEGQDIAELSADERAKLGMFLAFQYPHSVPGVTVANFLRTAVNSVRSENGNKVSPREFRAELRERMAMLKMEDSVAGRYINEGFSGGEKKRAEILQMAMLKPKLAIMDETDSGLDIDALKIVADGVNSLLGPELGVLLITHYQRLLNYITPDFVHVMVDGRIVANGGAELAHELEKSGYAAFSELPTPIAV